MERDPAQTPPAVAAALHLHRRTILTGAAVSDEQVREVVLALSEAGAAADRGALRADLSRALAYWTGQACRRNALSDLSDIRLAPYRPTTAAPAVEAGLPEAQIAARATEPAAAAATDNPTAEGAPNVTDPGDTAVDVLRLSNTAYLWKRNKDDGALFEGKTLERARELVGDSPRDRVLREFLAASDAHALDRKRRAEEARKRGLLRGTIVILVLLLAAAALVLVQFKRDQSRAETRAEEEEEKAEQLRAEVEATKESLRMAQAEISDLQSRVVRAESAAERYGQFEMAYAELEPPPHIGPSTSGIAGLWDPSVSEGPVASGGDPGVPELIELSPGPADIDLPPDEIPATTSSPAPGDITAELDSAPTDLPAEIGPPVPSFGGFLREGLDLGPPELPGSGGAPLVLNNALVVPFGAGGLPHGGAAMLDRTTAEILPAGAPAFIVDPVAGPRQAVTLVAQGDVARLGQNWAAVDQDGNLVPVTSALDVIAWDALAAHGQFGFAPAADKVLIYAGATYGPNGVADRLWKVLVAADGVRSGRDLVVEAYCIALPVTDQTATPDRWRLTLAELSAAVGAVFDDQVAAADRPTGPSTSPCATPPPSDLAGLDPSSVVATRAALDHWLAHSARPASRGKGADTPAAPMDIAATLSALATVPRAIWDDPAFGHQAARARRLVASQPRDPDGSALIVALGLDAQPRSVEVSFAGMTRERIDNLRAALLAVGWDLPRASRTEQAAGQSILRYAPADAALAVRLRNDLAAAGWNDVTLQADDNTASGRMALWLSL